MGARRPATRFGRAAIVVRCIRGWRERRCRDAAARSGGCVDRGGDARYRPRHPCRALRIRPGADRGGRYLSGEPDVRRAGAGRRRSAGALCRDPATGGGGAWRGGMDRQRLAVVVFARTVLRGGGRADHRATDEGHRDPRPRPGARPGGGGRAGDRSQAAGREPDDRRPDAQRPVARGHAGQRAGARAVRGRNLSQHPPTGVVGDGRAAARHDRGRCDRRAVSVRIDHRRAQAPRDAGDRRGRGAHARHLYRGDRRHRCRRRCVVQRRDPHAAPASGCVARHIGAGIGRGRRSAAARRMAGMHRQGAIPRHRTAPVRPGRDDGVRPARRHRAARTPSRADDRERACPGLRVRSPCDAQRIAGGDLSPARGGTGAAAAVGVGRDRGRRDAAAPAPAGPVEVAVAPCPSRPATCGCCTRPATAASGRRRRRAVSRRSSSARTAR